MNLGYFRKSTYSLEETVKNLQEVISASDWKKLGQADLPDGQGTMILVCRPDWIGTVIKSDHNLLGFLPCSITVFQKGTDVLVGTGQPAILKAITRSEDVTKLASEAEGQIYELIHKAAGVTARKPSYVKLYSTATCPYCKMEKTWLDENGVKHEVVMVDQDQKEAERMVERTGQMGVPVTEIGYDDSEPEYVVGFDKAKLSSALQI